MFAPLWSFRWERLLDRFVVFEQFFKITGIHLEQGQYLFRWP